MAQDAKFFYVIGGEYTDANFSGLRAGTSIMDGPFAERAEAMKVWQGRSQKSTSNVLERYDIVELLHVIPRSAFVGMTGS